MHVNTVVLSIALIVLVVWLGWTAYVRLGVKEPSFTVLERTSGFELRQYEPFIVAYTDVEGSHSEAINNGFRILANYIFGGNTKKESIAMTVPVMEGVKTSEKIAMTAPVTEEVVGNKRRVSFVMPSGYTLDSLPTPDDSRVQFLEIPAKKFAVLRFGWYANDSRISEKKHELLTLVTQAGLTSRAEPIYAGYSDPWTFPLFIRNEILLEVE